MCLLQDLATKKLTPLETGNLLLLLLSLTFDSFSPLVTQARRFTMFTTSTWNYFFLFLDSSGGYADIWGDGGGGEEREKKDIFPLLKCVSIDRSSTVYIQKIYILLL